MTTEVAILNQAGVALAADSAVTVTGSGAKEKVYNTVNKIFMLSKHHPVGVMVYGSANVNGIPWETLIKLYRKQLNGKSFNTIREYSANFLAFLSGSSSPISDYQKDFFILSKSQEICGIISAEVVDQFERASAEEPTKPKDAGQIASYIIEQIKIKIAECVDLGKYEQVIKNLTAKYSDRQLSIIKGTFQGFYDHIPTESINELIDALCTYFYSDFIIGGESGIVISGFGEDEIFPKVTCLRIQGFFEGTGKFLRETAKCADDSDDKFGARVIPFAMDDMIHAFMTGLDPQIKKFLYASIENTMPMIAEKVHRLLSQQGLENSISIEKLRSITEVVGQQFHQGLDQFISDNHVSPVTNMLQFLPKDELSEMAETLVSLIAFRKKVTYATESVGGPIDVAMITKGDGFVWVKRKYYFDPNLNQHYLSNYNRD